MGRRVVIWVLAVAILLGIGCDNGIWRLFMPPLAAITGDNLGGAIAFYQTQRISEDLGNSSTFFDAHFHVEFYAQKISPEGKFLWGGRGILIASGDAAHYWDRPLYAVSNSSGGTVVIWDEPLPEPPYSQPHVAKIDSGGNVAWERNIPGVDRVIPDGLGGVIIAYSDGNGNLSVLKIDAEGNLPWGEDGVSLDLGGSDICSDKLGGVIVVGELGGNLSTQRVDSGGNILWQTGGVQVCVSWPAVEPQVVSDGSGGAIIAYEYGTPCSDGTQANCDSGIYAQRIDAKGSVLWGSDGVPVCVEPQWQYSPRIVDDGTGGAIVFFVSIENNSPAIRALRIDADGRKLWPEYVQVWEDTYISAISDGSGGAISVCYSHNEGEARVQRLDAAGRKLWGPDGTRLTFHDWHGLLAAPDGCGGVLSSWSTIKRADDEVSRVSYYVASYHVQRVDAGGNVSWGDEGILLNP